jgi:hypothetical protein
MSQFIAPLLNKLIRDKDADSRFRSIEFQLPENQPRLDRLSKSDFICKQIADDRIAQNPIGDLHLMCKQVDLRRKECGKSVRKTMPLLVMLDSAVLLEERPTLEQTGGIGVTVLGSAVFISEKATAGWGWGVLLVLTCTKLVAK